MPARTAGADVMVVSVATRTRLTGRLTPFRWAIRAAPVSIGRASCPTDIDGICRSAQIPWARGPGSRHGAVISIRMPSPPAPSSDTEASLDAAALNAVDEAARAIAGVLDL